MTEAKLDDSPVVALGESFQVNADRFPRVVHRAPEGRELIVASIDGPQAGEHARRVELGLGIECLEPVGEVLSIPGVGRALRQFSIARDNVTISGEQPFRGFEPSHQVHCLVGSLPENELRLSEPRE